MESTAALTTGALRSLLLVMGVSSMHESFQSRGAALTIPRTHAAAPSTKVRIAPLPKKALEAATDAGTALVVDLGVAGTGKKNAATYGAVFASEPTDGPCWHCKREVLPGHKVGIPLRIRDDRFHHVLIVDIEGRACNSSCAFAFVRDHVAEHSCYEGRETAMQQINEICSPGTTLRAAPNWRLLKINGGPLSDEEFNSGVCQFRPTPNLQLRLCSLTFGPS